MISIIIPTLNEEGVLEQTLTNLSLITSPAAECVISDGRSTDNTVSIAKQFTKKIVVYQGTRRQTIAHARNLGAKMASGEFLVFMDADVRIPDPTSFFEDIVAMFHAEPNLIAITTSIRVAPEQETWKDRPFFLFMDFTHWVCNNLLSIGSASGEFQMIRASTFREIGGFNDELVAYEDHDIFIRLAKKGNTRMLGHKTVFHSGRRVHKVGHLKLLFIWTMNGIWVNFFKHALSKEWEMIR